MSEGNPRLAEPRDPIRGAYDEEMAGQQSRDLVPAHGTSNMEVKAGVITAQRCDVKRDLVAIRNNLKVLSQMNGDAYVYRIPFKNRQRGTTDIIKGGTIKLAQDLAREWGNCEVDCRVEENSDHFMIYARFIDYERGYSHTRPFKQRKGQDTGMKDRGRAEDLILQIGASKAIRNVILAVLGSFAQFMQEEAEGSVLRRIENNKEEARKFITTSLADLEVPINRVERIMGRKVKEWKPTDMARIYGQLSAVKDNMIDAEDVWPANADDADDVAAAERRDAGDGDDAGEEPETEGTDDEGQEEAESEGEEEQAEESENPEPEPEPKKPAAKKKAAKKDPPKKKTETKPEPEPAEAEAEAEEPDDDPGPSDEGGGDEDESELDGLDFS